MSKLSSTSLLLGALVRRCIWHEMDGYSAVLSCFDINDTVICDMLDKVKTLHENGCIGFTDEGTTFCVTKRGFELASKVYDRMNKNPLTASEQLMLEAILM